MRGRVGEAEAGVELQPIGGHRHGPAGAWSVQPAHPLTDRGARRTSTDRDFTPTEAPEANWAESSSAGRLRAVGRDQPVLAVGLARQDELHVVRAAR